MIREVKTASRRICACWSRARYSRSAPLAACVIAVRRRCGRGTRIFSEGIRAAREHYGAREIRIEAQTSTRRLYENLGFRQTTEEFLEDGIPLIGMLWQEDT